MSKTEFIVYLWGIEINESLLYHLRQGMVYSLPMRNWNKAAYIPQTIAIIVYSLPMRNWNDIDYKSLIE